MFYDFLPDEKTCSAGALWKFHNHPSTVRTEYVDLAGLGEEVLARLRAAKCVRPAASKEFHETVRDMLLISQRYSGYFWSYQTTYSLFTSVLFEGVTFFETNFHGSSFNDCVFRNCSFHGVNTSSAYFTNCSFEDTLLTSTSFVPEAAQRALIERAMDAMQLSEEEFLRATLGLTQTDRIRRRRIYDMANINITEVNKLTYGQKGVEQWRTL